MTVCTTCGEANPERARFCLNCGAALERGPAPSVQTERKVVTILFCDLVGFTARSEFADPEDVQARLTPYHRRLRTVIESFGGTVEKFIGDAVMAVFGAPVTHEDDPERAVRAGLRILDAIHDLNEEKPGADLAVRIGINTGEVVVTLGARPELGEAMVAGDAVNTAARLQSAAPVGAAVVGEQTYRSTERVFVYESLPAVAAKGKSEPLALWRAEEPRARLGTDLAGARGTPYIGREAERARLLGLFDRTVRDASVNLVTVIGEPGLGKSRLVGELFSHTDAQPGLTRWRQGRCLPYGDGVTFWPLTEIVKAEAGILESDTADVVRAKLLASVPERLADRDWIIERLGPLVGLEGLAGTDREEAFNAWRRFLEAKAQERSSVFVVEDLHWADDAMLAFLDHVAERALGVPLLFVITARPELYDRHPSWGGGRHGATTINLNPLSETETAQLVSVLMDRTNLPVEVQRVVLERAAGNPLYAEEFVRLLKDRGVLVDDGAGGVALAPGAQVPLPEGIGAIIAARLDTLPLERKRLLQDASVVGKVFWSGAVTEMGARERGGVLIVLNELSRQELVRPAHQSSMAGESEYGFWHVLVRDVAYGQIPRASRADKHRRAAAWIESVASERLDDLAEVLAYHLTTALDLARAAGRTTEAAALAPAARRFLALAGDRQMSLDVTKAGGSYRRALELCAPEDPERAALLVKLGEAARWRGESEEAARLYSEGADALRAQGADEAADQARLLQARSLNNLDRGDEGRALVDQVIARWETLPPTSVLARALADRSNYTGPSEEQIRNADRAIALADALDLPDVRARALTGRGRIRASSIGDASGFDDLREAIAISHHLGESRSIGNAYSTLADALTNQSPVAALKVLDEGLAYVSGKGLTLAELALMSSRTFALTELGRFDDLVIQADEQIALASTRGATFYISNAEAFLIHERSFRGDLVAASNRAEALMRSGTDWGPFVCVYRMRGRRATGRLAEAAALLEASIEVVVGRNEDFGDHASMLAREAVRIGRPDLIERCRLMVVGELPLARCARMSVDALVAEASQSTDAALAGFRAAHAGWLEYGNAMEQAHAMLGQARCLVRLDRHTEADAAWSAAEAQLDGLGIPRGTESDSPLEHAVDLFGARLPPVSARGLTLQ